MQANSLKKQSGMRAQAKSRHRRDAMKILVSALLALSILSAAAAPVGAAEFDSKTFWQQQGNRY
jgi:hypothetical protein